jgi:hypothetical protein
LKIVNLSKDNLAVADLDIFVGADYIATVHKSPVAILSRLAENGAASTGPPDEDLHRILDVVDSCLPKIVLSESQCAHGISISYSQTCSKGCPRERENLMLRKR